MYLLVLIASLMSVTCASRFWLRTVDGEEDFRHFFRLTGQISNNRPVYVAGNEKTFLYHVEYPENNGRWMIGPDVGDTSCEAFIDSWAVTPPARDFFETHTMWQFAGEDGVFDPREVLIEFDRPDDQEPDVDTTIYVYSEAAGMEGINGYYYESGLVNDERGVWRSLNGMYVYYVSDEATGLKRWFVGSDVGSMSALAFIDLEWPNPLHLSDAKNRGFYWHTAPTSERPASEGGEWPEDATMQVISNANDKDVYQNVREFFQVDVSDDESVNLLNGYKMPLVGFGIRYSQEEDSVVNAIVEAGEVGYRLLDSAQVDGIDELTGRALKRMKAEAGVESRRQLFLTTKVWLDALGYEQTLRSVEQSMLDLGTTYLNLVLIHWPECYPSLFSWCPEQQESMWKDSWRALERFVAEGRILSIGISNFNADQFEQLLEIARVRPMVIQNLMDPTHFEGGILGLAEQNGVFFQAYGTLNEAGFAVRENDETPHYAVVRPAILDVAAALSRSEFQVILRHVLQKGAGVLPRSSNKEHMKENLDVFSFELTAPQMQDIDEARVTLEQMAETKEL